MVFATESDTREPSELKGNAVDPPPPAAANVLEDDRTSLRVRLRDVAGLSPRRASAKSMNAPSPAAAGALARTLHPRAHLDAPITDGPASKEAQQAFPSRAFWATHRALSSGAWKRGLGRLREAWQRGPRDRVPVAVMMAVAAAAFFLFAYRRFATCHNETFDLAFYARMAWGYAHVVPWDPIIGAVFPGLHLSFVLIPLGWLGLVFGQVPVLLAAQSLALAATCWPLARVGSRRLGPWGGCIATLAFLLFPNVFHVATTEFHPGSLALLPLAWALDAADRNDAKSFRRAVIGVLLCREDFALVTAIMGGLMMVGGQEPMRRAGRTVFVGSLLYFAVFALCIHPLMSPASGSFEAHFGKWGQAPVAALIFMIRHPTEVGAHLLAPQRLMYIPSMLWPLACLPLLAPRWLLCVLPVLAINVFSDFPGTTDLSSHYLSPAVPVLVFCALLGASSLRIVSLQKAARWGLVPVALVAHLWEGGSPVAADFDAEPFLSTQTSRDRLAVIAEIPPTASVQAPDALLPHLAERLLVHRAPPPEMNTQYVVLDAQVRRRFAHIEDLLRTEEEPIVRNWLARSRYGLVAIHGDAYVFRQDADGRRGPVAPYLGGRVEPPGEHPRYAITACLDVLEARRLGDDVLLALWVKESCPSDIALRLGLSPRPTRVDLPLRGWLSPSSFWRGELLFSKHRLPEVAHATQLWVGSVRSSGARTRPEDPHTLAIPFCDGQRSNEEAKRWAAREQARADAAPPAAVMGNKVPGQKGAPPSSPAATEAQTGQPCRWMPDDRVEGLR